MATEAPGVDAVVARVIPRRTVTERARNPAAGGMAHVALYVGAQMPPGLGGGATAIGVASITCPRGAGIVHPCTAQEGGGGVAEMAVQVGGQVAEILSDRRGAVAGCAIVHDAGVIEHRADERIGVVTHAAVLKGRHVKRGFSRGKTGTVTGRAVIHDSRVIEGGRKKSGGLVAIRAVPVGRYVIRRRDFSPRRNTVMAHRAIADDALVIVFCTGKRRGVMTLGTVLARRHGNMGQGQTGRRRAIVAGGTVVNNAGVVEHRGHKGAAGHVTDAAILAGDYVRGIGLCILAGRTDPVVAGVTPFTHHLGAGVIHKRVEEIRRVMAHRTVAGGVQMNGRTGLSSGSERDIPRTSIVAGGTVIGDAHMQKRRDCRNECSGGMASIAILRGRQVRGRFV